MNWSPLRLAIAMLAASGTCAPPLKTPSTKYSVLPSGLMHWSELTLPSLSFETPGTIATLDRLPLEKVPE